MSLYQEVAIVLISRVCRRTVSHMLCGVWVHLTLQLHMSYGGLLCRHRDEVCLVHVTLHPDRLIGPNQFHTCKLVLHAQAVLLTVGRLCCVLHGSKSYRHSAASEELARMALTLLLDTLGSEDVSLSQVDACAVYTLACLGVSYGLQDCR